MRGTLVYEAKDANAGRYSNNGAGAALALEGQPSDRVQIFMRYKYRQRNYDDAEPGDRNFEREDDVQDIIFNITWRFTRSWGVRLEDFYRTYYAPNNCTLVVVGDITPAEVYRLSEVYFGPLAAQDPPRPIRTVEPAQSGERRITIETDAQAPLLHVAFHAGRAGEARTLNMDLLLNILVGGDSSRLHQRLVENDRLAISVGGFQQEGFDPGTVYFYITLPPGGAPAAAEAALFDELARIVDEGVAEAELAKAKNIRLADFWRELATIDGKAAALGRHERGTGFRTQ